MSRTQLYIGLNLLDFNNEINVKRQINDYRDPGIGSSVKSYTLEIPLTKTNRKHLGFVDDVRSRVEVSDVARLVVNGMEVIRGKFRILSVEGLNVRAIIEGSDWVSDISGTSIKALSWAGGDEHDFTSTNIENSWIATAGALYRYPLINFAALVSDGWGAGSTVYPYDFYPSWNVEDIVTKIFLDAGYTLASGSFFAGTFGQSLYLLSAPVPAVDEFIVGKNLDVYVDGNTDNQVSRSMATLENNTLDLSQIVDIDAETEDEGSDFSTVANQYTVPEDGTYRFQFETEVWCTFNRSPAQWSVQANSITLSIRKNGTNVEAVTTSGVTTFDTANAIYSVDTGYIYLEAGDTIEAYVILHAEGTNTSPGTLTAYLYLTAGATTSFLINVWDEQCLWPGIGQTISPTDYLPDIDGVDFLKGLKEAFNLRFFVDRNNKTVYIETSDDFYGSTIIDWSDKIDYSQGVKMEIISASYRENQKFKWRPDTADKAYANYVSANGLPFVKDLVIDSEYVKAGIQERENAIFSPTIQADMAQVGHYGDLVPKITGSGEYVSASRPYPASRPKQWNPRIFEWKGMVAFSSGSFNYYSDIEDTSAANYTTFPSMETPDMSDMYDDYLLKDWNRIEKNKIVTVTLVLTPAEIMKFMTVVGTAANEGFRATYKLNIEGVDMLFICSKIITDGDRVQAEFIQKM